MKTVYNILRALLIVVISLAVALPVSVYVGLSIPAVQHRVARVAETELSTLLGARVTVGDLGITPFNRVALRDVTVETAPGDTALTVRRLGAGINLWSLVSGDRIAINYVELIGLDGRLRRATPDSPLNIQPIIDALSPKDRNKPPTLFDLKVSTVIMRSSALRYDVESAPHADGRFDPAHLAVTNLRADLRLPRIANDDFTIDIKRLALEASPGFELRDLKGWFHIAADGIEVRGLTVETPNSTLAFADMALPLQGLNSIGRALEQQKLTIALDEGSNLYLPDLAPFVPALAHLPLHTTFNRLEAGGNLNGLSVDLDLDLGGAARLTALADASNLRGDLPELNFTDLELALDGNRMADLLATHPDIPATVGMYLRRAGAVTLTADGRMTRTRVSAEATLRCALGTVSVEGDGSLGRAGGDTFDAEACTDGDFDLGTLLADNRLGVVNGHVTANATGRGKRWTGEASADMERIDYNGTAFTGLLADAEFSPGSVSGHAALDNPGISFDLAGGYQRLHDDIKISAEGYADCPDLGIFTPSMAHTAVKSNISVDLAGADFNSLEGHAILSDVAYVMPDGRRILLDNLALNSSIQPDGTHRIALSSDYLNGLVTGQFDFARLPADCRHIAAALFPALITPPAQMPGRNEFSYGFSISQTEKLAADLRLPVSIVYPATLRGEFSGITGRMSAALDIPYLRQGNKLIENTRLTAEALPGRPAQLAVTTTAPTQNGPMTLTLNSLGSDNQLSTDISWKIDRARAYEGSVSALTTFLPPTEAGGRSSRIDLRESTLTFNDSVWVINPAQIAVNGRDITVNGIDVSHGRQFVKINGEISPDPEKALTLDLSHFSLDYLFETLGIDKVMLGGDATGTFYASGLYSPEPVLETPGLTVKDISYNKTVIGDALVRSTWDPSRRAITLDADIDRPGHRARVDGAIFPLNDSLDLKFFADHTPVGFMAPYMEAFASDISGYASGWARLWGNFKYIDLEGALKADSLRLKVNFTNTYYTASDSVRFTPGYIDLSDITIRDAEGHTADLNGWVRHKFFKEPQFRFSVTNARDFLSYNETAAQNPLWYGKIYGNGSAFVDGRPGIVNINVDMTSAPRSTFTFVLSDQEVADEFSFLTFRDRNRLGVEITDTMHLRDTSMDLVNELRARAAAHGDDETPSDYNITIQTRITPDAQIVLVMDPVGGDRIRARGSGHLRLDYGSANNDLKMYGNYTLDRGDYNFTLQDIIIKDFTIRPGSEISFRGDPYAAQLDIKAAYSLRANLSDLDESFLHDKELNRTNVPVNALMHVTGDMRQPEIDFDLEFPTLTSDVYRKVRSIVSTDDMMNRQIIYLLALNRFYTPDYMASATRGNELMSVASSTISSQLSNLLGSISDNWSVAPSFRSDRDDFSDVEVDVALSSRLLNNRLLFNGNFGYRDKSLNANQFIGDFDLEYLLNRQGTLRLKAYNRYNDQNYYLRSALTTQGVGVAIRRDFDSLTSFLRPVWRWFRRLRKPAPTPTPADTPSETTPATRSDASPAATPSDAPTPSKPE